MKSYFNNFGDISALTNSKIQEIPEKSTCLHSKLKKRPTRSISKVSLENILDATLMCSIRNTVIFLIILSDRLIEYFLKHLTNHIAPALSYFYVLGNTYLGHPDQI